MGSYGADCFLIDASAAGRIHKAGSVEKWEPVLRQGRIGMCASTEAELLVSARSVEQYERMHESFGALYTRCGVPGDAWARVHELQRGLARAGCHRSAGVVDLLVAVTALHHRLTLLHYDRDFETIAEHTGLRTQWVAEPGGVD
ncbi:PIN domain nuclease [Streptomyces sp. NPDC057654]|uniref:PIN domain nuclease n=1 Tax=Streptomyces sp. NPDC057654 TaxID=3346196 RepID=UPI003675D349